tara:strand:+ start:29 stop:1279 length:1251 start_codon:yes stop_codon:yes gene_type:complete
MKKKLQIAVVGAGISGLSFAKLATKKGFTVKVFEASSHVGGIARVKDLDNGVPYHMIGGHCFNSKHQDVLDFVFNDVLPLEKWHKINRKASIYFKNTLVDYPIEYSMKQIFEIDENLAINMIKDFINANGVASDNLQDWFINNFGNTLAEEYFIPYNKKIWKINPKEMSPDWVVDKLPMPNKNEFIKGLISSGADSMPHASFYYPKSGSQNKFIAALAKDIDIKFDFKIEHIIRTSTGKFSIDGIDYDHLVITAPLNEIHNLIDIKDNTVTDSISKLKYNKVTTVIWKSKPTEDTWTYIPSTDIPFHRLIHIGNFIGSEQNYSISEAVGEVTYQDMIKSGEKIDQLIEPLDYNVSDHAYVVFDKNTNTHRNTILNHFENTNIHPLGRFGEWEYYNMDICIKKSIDLVNKIVAGNTH